MERKQMIITDNQETRENQGQGLVFMPAHSEGMVDALAGAADRLQFALGSSEDKNEIFTKALEFIREHISQEGTLTLSSTDLNTYLQAPFWDNLQRFNLQLAQPAWNFLLEFLSLLAEDVINKLSSAQQMIIGNSDEAYKAAKTVGYGAVSGGKSSDIKEKLQKYKAEIAQKNSQRMLSTRNEISPMLLQQKARIFSLLDMASKVRKGDIASSYVWKKNPTEVGELISKMFRLLSE
jgi:hypothetical protein